MKTVLPQRGTCWVCHRSGVMVVRVEYQPNLVRVECLIRRDCTEQVLRNVAGLHPLEVGT